MIPSEKSNIDIAECASFAQYAHGRIVGLLGLVPKKVAEGRTRYLLAMRPISGDFYGDQTNFDVNRHRS